MQAIDSLEAPKRIMKSKERAPRHTARKSPGETLLEMNAVVVNVDLVPGHPDFMVNHVDDAAASDPLRFCFFSLEIVSQVALLSTHTRKGSD